MNKLSSVNSTKDIPSRLRKTPIELLLKYHNLDHKHKTYSDAKILIGMCMDNRKRLCIPDNFAYILRSGGANLRYSEFKVSYAIAIGNIHHIALIAHNHCGMVNLIIRKNEFIEGLVKNTGWTVQETTNHFEHNAPLFEINNEIDFILSETKRLRLKYPKIIITPLLYKVENNQLCLIQE